MPVPETNSGPAADLLIELRRDRRVALHRQIEKNGARPRFQQLTISGPW